MDNTDVWEAMVRKAEESLVKAGAPAKTPPVVEAPPVKYEWENELERALVDSHYNLVVPLTSGQKVRVVALGEVGFADPDGLMRISDATFRNLARCAVILKGKVSRVVVKGEHTDEIKAIVDKGEGYWAGPGVFVEIERKPVGSSSAPQDGVVAAPGKPETYPNVDFQPFLSVAVGTILEMVPMRLSSGKVIGSLLKTTHGPLHVRAVGENDHRLYVNAEWASMGGYTIDEGVFKQYLADPSTVIKFVRGAFSYFTTSEHILRHAGVIRSWGAAKIVMPLLGKFWLVVDGAGNQVGVDS